jgi:hypothetical protein
VRAEVNWATLVRQNQSMTGRHRHPISGALPTGRPVGSAGTSTLVFSSLENVYFYNKPMA